MRTRRAIIGLAEAAVADNRALAARVEALEATVAELRRHVDLVERRQSDVIPPL